MVNPSWHESDEEEVPSDVFFCMKVNVKVERVTGPWDSVEPPREDTGTRGKLCETLYDKNV